MDRIVIAISGKRGSGKDTVADFILKSWKTMTQRETRRASFAAPLKKMVSALLHGEYDKQETIDDLFMTVGRLYQRVGEAMREIDPAIFLVSMKIDLDNDIPKDVIISDLRFPNEMDFLKRYFDECIFIRVKEGPGRNDGRSSNHESETALDHVLDEKFDYVIHNTGTLEDLKEKCMLIVSAIVRDLHRSSKRSP